MVEEAAAFTVQPAVLLQVRVVESGDIEAVLWERTTTISTLPQSLWKEPRPRGDSLLLLA